MSRHWASVIRVSLPFSYLMAGLLVAQTALADQLLDDQSFLNHQQSEGRLLLAQWEGDDSYDPFADYSEFEETEEEEADINFFRNGRLFTISLGVNYRSYTGSLGDLYDTAGAFGAYLTYFFDLRFAIVVGFATGESNLAIPGTPTIDGITGTVSMTEIIFNIKYFFNTQNVTRGLARLNPYILGGITQFSRKERYTSTAEEFSDSAVGIDMGLGIEIPILRGQMYLGLQAAYRYVNFADENTEIILDGDTTNGATGIFPDGDILSMQAILGVNF